MDDERRRVLIVDDDEAIRIMVERVLRRENFEIDSARDGYEAIEKLASNDYDTILLDLTMPRVNGKGVIDFLEQARTDLDCQVIIMTASVPPADDIMRAPKVAHVLAKPFDIAELLENVRASAV